MDKEERASKKAVVVDIEDDCANWNPSMRFRVLGSTLVPSPFDFVVPLPPSTSLLVFSVCYNFFSIVDFAKDFSILFHRPLRTQGGSIPSTWPINEKKSELELFFVSIYAYLLIPLHAYLPIPLYAFFLAKQNILPLV